MEIVLDQFSLLNSTLELHQNSEKYLEDDDIFNSSLILISDEKSNNNMDIDNRKEPIQPMSFTFIQFDEDNSYELNINHNDQENISKAESDNQAPTSTINTLFEDISSTKFADSYANITDPIVEGRHKFFI
ncbi:hypothetical protein HZS_4159 [Henneguya salminicola]|nr:hypothetical protein HZS_4159 [Henneguya salminicola]